ncbi:MAG TPA: hypothetical protein VKB76_11180 [Ktedonobacterales bacterium]|nr:hypothetical protein [Ktedonobacterales bacterium]
MGREHIAFVFGIGINVVHNWERRGFPPSTHMVLAPMLKRAGHSFDAHKLFGQYPAIYGGQDGDNG